MTDIHTDVAIIGAGTAGLTALRELERLSLRGVLIDHGPLGTTCARVGCMPSKAVLHAAAQWRTLTSLLRGTTPPAGAARPIDLWRQARAIRDELAGGQARRTEEFAGDRLLAGTARFTGPDTLSVDGSTTVHAHAFIVATGSAPVVPKALAGLGDRVITTESLFDLDALPTSIGVLGLGSIGLEMGLALSRLGVRVVAGDMKPLPGGINDPDIGQRAIEHFSQEMTLWLDAPVETERTTAGVRMRSPAGEAEVDCLLAALGRRPNHAALDLAQAGVPLDEHGQPVLDAATLRGGTSRVLFAGDASQLRPLMHEAVDEGVLAARSAARLVDDREVSLPPRRTPLGIVYSDPDLAQVGQPYHALDLDRVVIGTAEGRRDGRSRIIGATDNLVRLYVERDSGRLLGAGLMAERGEHLAHLLAWAVQRGDTVDALRDLPYYHPSIEEMIASALQDAARQRRR